jgi:hypothetical protein
VNVAAAASPAVGAGRERGVLVVFAGLTLVMLMAALDSTIVSTALPTIVGDLGGLNHISWVVTAYLLAQTAVTPVYGKLGDLYGRKVVLQVALVVFLAEDPLVAAALPGRNDVPDGRHRRDHQPTAAEPLDGAESDQLGHVLGGAAQRRPRSSATGSAPSWPRRSRTARRARLRAGSRARIRPRCGNCRRPCTAPTSTRSPTRSGPCSSSPRAWRRSASC